MSEEITEKSHPLDGLPRHYHRVYEHWRRRGASDEQATKMALLAFSREGEYQEMKRKLMRKEL